MTSNRFIPLPNSLGAAPRVATVALWSLSPNAELGVVPHSTLHHFTPNAL